LINSTVSSHKLPTVEW